MNFDPISFAMGMNAGKKSAGGGGSGGGGSIEGVHYVTFMSWDGSTELYKRIVADGDDCADPVERGYINEPTKKSTAQYSYTHVGWSSTANGALDENILKAVTADKTVYANFAAVLRYYTITYYDSDGTTVLKTESLAYGATPSYEPEKEGFAFTGWVPALATVTGNAAYNASWTSVITFANASWTQIGEICAEGKALETFKVGDTKTLVLTMNESTILNVPVIVAGFEHDDLADGSGKAKMSIVCNRAITTIATGTMNNNYRWVSSNIRARLNYSGSIYNTLPEALKTVLKPVIKVTGNGRSVDGSFTTGAPEETTDYLWLLSFEEVNLSNFGNNADEGESYAIFTDNASRIRKNLSEGKASYLLRSGYTGYAGSMGAVSSNGTSSYGSTSTSTSTEKGIVFGFCI